MDDMERLVAAMLAGLRDWQPAERLTYRDALRRHARLDPAQADASAIAAVLAGADVDVPASVVGDRDGAFEGRDQAGSR